MRHKRAFYATNVRTKGSLSPGPLVGYYFAILIFYTKRFFRKRTLVKPEVSVGKIEKEMKKIIEVIFFKLS